MKILNKKITLLFSKTSRCGTYFIISLALLFIVGCAHDSSSHKVDENTPSKFGYGGTNTDIAFVTGDETATNNTVTTSTLDTNSVSTNNVSTNAPANPFLSTPPATTSATTHDIPYGTPVPGKPGFVTSPFAPKDRYVDVRGFPPGTEVKDPYSGKIFLVP